MDEVACHFEKTPEGAHEMWPVRFVLGDYFDRDIFLASFRDSFDLRNFEDKRQMNDWKELIAKTFHCSTEELSAEAGREDVADQLEKVFSPGASPAAELVESSPTTLSMGDPLFNEVSKEEYDE